MNTTEVEDFDYRALMTQRAPDTEKIRRGTSARKLRRAGAKERITIRIDHAVLEKFKELTPRGQGYQSLINEALREWLIARGVKELIREELGELTERVVSAVRATKRGAPK